MIHRRELTAIIALGSLGCVSLPALANAQAFPSKVIRFICAFPAGTGADLYVRYFAEKIQPLAGKPIIVDNKIGASGLLAGEFTSRSNPDGYTVMVHGVTPIVSMPALYKKPPFNATTDIEVVAPILTQPWMLIVPSSSPIKTLAQLTEEMKKKGDRSSYANQANAGTVMAELYKTATGVQSVEVKYRSANDSWNDIFSGQVDWAVQDPVATLAELRKGTVRILAVSTGKRVESVPDVPTMTEQGVPMDVTLWWAALVPPGVPAPIKAQIAEWFAKIVALPETKTLFNRFGADPLFETSNQSAARYQQDIKNWIEWQKIAKIEQQ